MRLLSRILLAIAVVSVAAAALAADSSLPFGMSVIKTIPEEATLEYRIHGRLVQSIKLLPGTYQIMVRQLEQVR